MFLIVFIFLCQAEDGIRDLVRSRGLGDVYKRQAWLDPEAGNPLLLESMLQPCPDDWLECEAA